jgi:hypothetical protein
MFSTKEKEYLARVVEAAILHLNHPDMPKKNPRFRLHIDGNQTWNYSDIQPNWTFDVEEPEVESCNQEEIDKSMILSFLKYYNDQKRDK